MTTIANTIRASLAQGKTNEQVLADVKAAHPTAKCEPTEKNIAAIKAKHVGCVVLNGMSDLAVLAAMRALA